MLKFSVFRIIYGVWHGCRANFPWLNFSEQHCPWYFLRPLLFFFAGVNILGRNIKGYKKCKCKNGYMQYSENKGFLKLGRHIGRGLKKPILGGIFQYFLKLGILFHMPRMNVLWHGFTKWRPCGIRENMDV